MLPGLTLTHPFIYTPQLNPNIPREQKAGIDPDVVIELDRPDELVTEWCLGRYHDAATVRPSVQFLLGGACPLVGRSAVFFLTLMYPSTVGRA